MSGGKSYRRSRDYNEPGICEALRAIPHPPGCTAPMPRVTVQPIEGIRPRKGSHMPSAGTPDLAIGCDGVTRIVEVKNLEANARMSGKSVTEGFAVHLKRWGLKICTLLSKEQHEWIDAWTGSPVAVVTNALEAAAALGLCLRCGADEPTGLCSGCQVLPSHCHTV